MENVRPRVEVKSRRVGALLLVFTLLLLTYGRAIDAARVFTGVPFAAVGGVLALWIRGIPFSISAGVGFVALSGIAVLGNILYTGRGNGLAVVDVSDPTQPARSGGYFGDLMSLIESDILARLA